LGLLGAEANAFAQEKIASWTETTSEVLARCFAIAGDTPEAEAAANEILMRWQAGKKIDSAHKIVALRAPFDTRLRQEMALQVLNNWRVEYRPVVASALTAFWHDPDAVTHYCRQILNQWRSDIEYQQRNKRRITKRNNGYIIKALAHPSLRKQVFTVAAQMLQVEANSPGFLTPLLHQRALEITQVRFPSWTGEEAETEPLDASQIAMLRLPKVPKPSSKSMVNPKIASSKPKRIENAKPPKSFSQAAKQSESVRLESWQEKLEKLKDLDQNE